MISLNIYVLHHSLLLFLFQSKIIIIYLYNTNYCDDYNLSFYINKKGSNWHSPTEIECE